MVRPLAWVLGALVCAGVVGFVQSIDSEWAGVVGERTAGWDALDRIAKPSKSRHSLGETIDHLLPPSHGGPHTLNSVAGWGAHVRVRLKSEAPVAELETAIAAWEEHWARFKRKSFGRAPPLGGNTGSGKQPAPFKPRYSVASNPNHGVPPEDAGRQQLREPVPMPRLKPSIGRDISASMARAAVSPQPSPGKPRFGQAARRALEGDLGYRSAAPAVPLGGPMAALDHGSRPRPSTTTDPDAVPGEPRPAADASERVELTAAQMDAVTAGLVAIDIDVLAKAIGPVTYTDATVETYALADSSFEIAFGAGNGFAAGDETAVDVWTEVYGDGGVVVGDRFGLVFDWLGYSEGHTGGFVVSIDPRHPRFAAIKRLAENLALRLEHSTDRMERHLQRGLRLAAIDAKLADAYLISRLTRDYRMFEAQFERGIATLLRYVQSPTGIDRALARSGGTVRQAAGAQAPGS